MTNSRGELVGEMLTQRKYLLIRVDLYLDLLPLVSEALPQYCHHHEFLVHKMVHQGKSKFGKYALH